MIARRGAAALAILLLAPLLIVAGGGTAHAHASQTGSTPSAGERLDRAPSRVVVTFDSALMDVGAALVVRGVDGGDVTSGPPVIVHNEISVPVRTDVPAGEYRVAYRVVSQDGHTVSTTFAYTVLGEGATASAPAPRASTPEPSSAGTALSREPAPTTSSGSGWLAYALGAALLALTVVVLGAIALRR